MSLAPGARLGPYEIQSAIGSGGMGEVYRARDTKLNRSVAIKILPELFAHDPERLARFEREAKTLASLNHPNIAIIHGFEEARGIQALVMELVEGPTLADRIAQGPIPLEEALPIAKQIAEALEAAHDQGIIHRDLKPANITLRSDGNVKVLDFGLAKALDSRSGATDVSQSPTITSPAMTGMGVILGTAAYMSPEQAKGKPVDKRADIWAFGCVIYEMLVGTRAFKGETVSETLAEVMKSEPPWTALPPGTPATLRNVVRRCLAKDPRQRVRDIGDVRLALEGAFETAAAMDTAAAVAVPRLRVWQRPAAAAVIALSLIATASLAVWALTRPSASRPVRLMVAPPAGETVGTVAPDPDLAISPDGSRIVYVASRGTGGAPQLYVRALDQLEAQPLQGLMDPRTPFMSPDGNWVGVFDEPNVLKKVTVNGGPALTICNISGGPRGASWGPDNTIVFATNDLATGLFRVSAGGGQADVLTKPDAQKGELDHYWPEVLPGGKAVLFTILSKADAVQSTQIAVLDLETGEQKVLVPGGSYPRYMPTGHLVYGVEGTLRAVAFDLDRLEVRSDPVPVLQRVVTKPTSGAASFSVAQDGSLVYLTRGIQASFEHTLAWVDRQGREETLKAPPRAYTNPRISPDGTKVALEVFDQENDIWVWDLGRATLTRLTFQPGFDGSPVWTPDGRRIAFSSTRGVASLVPNLYWQTADGTGAVERLTENAENQFPTSFSPDGTRLLFMENTSTTNNDIGILPLDGDRRGTPLVATTLQERNAEVSPDGRWVAYQSDESGRVEIYVRPFPEVNGGRWQVSTGGGIQPLWGRNGRELFYLVGPGRMMATPIQPGAGATFAAGNPRVVFDGQYVDVFPQARRSYDVSPDGQRFLMIKNARPTGEGPPPSQLIVVLHWFEELKRLVPTK